jgi:hypothetical protein
MANVIARGNGLGLLKRVQKNNFHMDFNAFLKLERVSGNSG